MTDDRELPQPPLSPRGGRSRLSRLLWSVIALVLILAGAGTIMAGDSGLIRIELFGYVFPSGPTTANWSCTAAGHVSLGPGLPTPNAGAGLPLPAGPEAPSPPHPDISRTATIDGNAAHRAIGWLSKDMEFLQDDL